MNKYIVRTSLVWMALLLILGAAFATAPTFKRSPPPVNADERGNFSPCIWPASRLQASQRRQMPDAKPETPLVPVQLSPERMQSIGVTVETVEYRQFNDDIRAHRVRLLMDERSGFLCADAVSRLHSQCVRERHLPVRPQRPATLHDLQP